MGQGVDALVPPTTVPVGLQPWYLDHFTPFGAGLPNFVLARGFEQALTDSGKRVVLALPVPADGSHNSAAGPKLPAMLRDIHRLLQAVGDVTPAPGPGLGRPRLGIGAHSLGSDAAFQALATAPKAYSEALFFDPTAIGVNMHVVGLASAHFCLGGFSRNLVGVPFRTLKRSPGIAARLRLIPKGYTGDAPDTASIADIVGRSPGTAAMLNPRSLGHALNPIKSPPDTWVPRVLQRPTPPKVISERFEMLHQYIVFGGDNGGGGLTEQHFLTQALADSSFR